MKEIYRPAKDQGTFPFSMEIYGNSAEGIPLRYLPARQEAQLLVFAAIHGEEPETTFLLSRAVRMLPEAPAHVACILSANPDGLLRGTRANANGVDLNRNFPTKDWTREKTYSRLTLESPREVALDTGDAPASEPETRALVDLVRLLGVKRIVSLHSPFGWVDSDNRTELSVQLEKVFSLPWKSGAGYPTPGSFGTFARENGLECVTVELPRKSPEQLSALYAKPLADFLKDFRLFERRAEPPFPKQKTRREPGL